MQKPKTNLNVDCINSDKFNKLISELHESIETNKQILKVVEGERSSITYLIQKMNSDLVKLKEKSDAMIDIDIQNETIRLKDRVNNLKTLLNTKLILLNFQVMSYLKQYYKSYN